MAFDIVTESGDAKAGKHFIVGIQGIEKNDPLYILGLQEDSTLTRGGDLLDEQSKQGRILQGGTHEDTISLDKYIAVKDSGYEALKSWKQSDKQFKVWQTDITPQEADPVKIEGSNDDKDTMRTYPAEFGFAYGGDLELSAPKDGLAEVSIEAQIIGQLTSGRMPLSDATVAFAKETSVYQNPGDTIGEYPGSGTTTTTTTKP